MAAGEDFSVDELDAMFHDLVGKGLLPTQESPEEEDNEVQEIKHLDTDIESGGATVWKKLFDILNNEPEFSVEDFNQVLPPLLDALSQPQGVTDIALETLDLLLQISPESFQLSEQQLENLITMLCREILDCDKDNFWRKGSSFSCLSTVIYKSFNRLGEYRGMTLNLFAAESAQLPLYNEMRQWVSNAISKKSLNDVEIAVAERHVRETPILFYMSILSSLKLEETSDRELHISVCYLSDFSRGKFQSEWKELQDKHLGNHFLNFVKIIMFRSVVFPTLHLSGKKLVAELATLLVPKGDWQDFEHLILENLEAKDFDKNNEMLLIIEGLIEAWTFGKEESIRELINRLFPAALEKLKTHELAANAIRQMMICEPKYVTANESRRLIMRKLAKWIREMSTPTEIPSELKELNDGMRFILTEIIYIEEQSGGSDPQFLEAMKKLAL